MGMQQATCDEWVADTFGVDPATYLAGQSAQSSSVSRNLFGSPGAPPPGQPSQKPPANGPAPPKPAPPPTPAQIRVLQGSLSKWQVANGGVAIKDSGNLDDDTKKAILEFQRQSGLRQDGLDGPAVEKRMSLLLDILKNYPASIGDPPLQELTGSAGFGSMDGQTQDAALERIKTYVGDIKTLHEARLLETLVKERGFEELSHASQKLLLDVMAARPGDMPLGGDLDQLVASAAFRKLDEKTREKVLHRIKKYGGDRDKVENIEHVVAATMPFAELSKETQNVMLDALANNPADTGLADGLRRAVEGNLASAMANIDFRNLDQQTQTSVLQRIERYPSGDMTSVDNLMILETTPALTGLPFDLQEDILDALPGRFPGVPLTPGIVANLMDLATDPAFADINPKFRNLMLDLLAARPDNIQLVAAFRSLIGMPGFKYDHRTAERRIMDADQQTP